MRALTLKEYIKHLEDLSKFDNSEDAYLDMMEDIEIAQEKAKEISLKPDLSDVLVVETSKGWDFKLKQ